MGLEITTSSRSIGTRGMQHYLDNVNQEKKVQERQQQEENRVQTSRQQQEVTKKAVEQVHKSEKIGGNINTYA